MHNDNACMRLLDNWEKGQKPRIRRYVRNGWICDACEVKWLAWSHVHVSYCSHSQISDMWYLISDVWFLILKGVSTLDNDVGVQYSLFVIPLCGFGCYEYHECLYWSINSINFLLRFFLAVSLWILTYFCMLCVLINPIKQKKTKTKVTLLQFSFPPIHEWIHVCAFHLCIYSELP